MIAKFLILCVAVGIANAGLLKSATIIKPEITLTKVLAAPIVKTYAAPIVKTYSAPIVHKIEAPRTFTTFIEHRPELKVAVHAAPSVIVKSAPLLRYATGW